jgi:hypothetical protein
MRRRCAVSPLVFLALAALAVAAVAPSAALDRPAKRRADCRTAGTTIDAGPGGRVFYRPTRDPNPVYFCSYRTRRRTMIGSDDCFQSAQVELTRFSRRFLAVDINSCSPGVTTSELDLRRTRDGRRVRWVAAVPGPVVPFSAGDVTDLVLRGDGALAWIVAIFDTASSPPRYQVRTSLRGTGSTLLAEGTDIASGSLALAGSTLYWTQAGAPRSTSLEASLAAR